jgi:regulator of cell morphogenesis and NO signaling
MGIEELSAALEREHREIDEGIESFASGSLPGDAGKLSGAIQALRRHIYLEEAFLFPLLREGDPALFAPVLVMLREHGQLWDLLDLLDEELAARPGGETMTGLCKKLTVMLLHHNLKEEKVLYPQADELLPESAAERLRQFMAAGQLPEGWACARASTRM